MEIKSGENCQSHVSVKGPVWRELLGSRLNRPEGIRWRQDQSHRHGPGNRLKDCGNLWSLTGKYGGGGGREVGGAECESWVYTQREKERQRQRQREREIETEREKER